MQSLVSNIGRYYLAWLSFVVAAILFTVTASKPNVVNAAPQQPIVDIVEHDGELLNLTVDYPREIKVKNISNRQISNFTVEMSDPTEGGKSDPLTWGTHPHFGKTEKLLVPGDVVALAIPQPYVDDFVGVQRIEIRTGSVFMDNDEKVMWRNGYFLQQDKNDWKKWRRTDLGAKSNHHAAHVRHHSIPLAKGMFTPQCNAEWCGADYIQCTAPDPCNPSETCQVYNEIFVPFGNFYANQQSNLCKSPNPFCQSYGCGSERKLVWRCGTCNP